MLNNIGEPSSHSVPLAPFDSGAWMLAFSIVFASRLGRLTSQEARLDVRRLQRDRERGRALSTELRKRRETWLLEEAARLAGEDALRVEEAAARAREEARRQAEVQRRMREEAEEAAARLAIEREAKRKEYEATQAILDSEYKARVEKEQQLLEEARQRQREEEEARRRAAEEQKRQKEEERRRREEEERKAREEAARLKAEERKRLEKEKQRFAIRLEGSVAVERPPRGTLLPGPLEKEAIVRVSLTAGSLLGGQGVPVEADFGSLEDASIAAPLVVGQSVRGASDGAASALRLQAMTGSGPMSVMEQPEQYHWMAMATARSAVAGLRCAEISLARFQDVPATRQQEGFQVRTEVGVLPAGHPQSIEAVMGQAIALIEAGEGDKAVSEVLQNLMEIENEAFYKELGALPKSLHSAPRTLGSALELAHFLNRMLYDRPARSSDAPAWFEGAAALVREQLAVLVKAAPADSLETYAAILGVALGEENPIASEAAALAAANLSAAEKARRSERERARQAELAAKLLEEEWPDAEEIRAARFAENESRTPIAERVWALRNVAGTLAMGGPGERARARQLLEQAVQLKQQFAGAPDHPAVLPELIALAEVLERDSDWSEDAAGVAALMLRVLSNIAGAYSQIGDNPSAAVLMESGLRRWEEAAGVRSPAVRAATRRADQLLEALTSEQRSQVAAKRGEASAIILKAAEGLTEQLGAYQESSSRSKAQEWDELGAAMLGPLL